MNNSGAFEGNIVDIHARQIFFGRVTWTNGVIASVVNMDAPRAGYSYLSPGFVDAHVHIESSMLTPAEFGRVAVRHGTVAVVSDPHEIANVLGVEGIDFMVQSAKAGPLHICFGAPPCVPATPFETSGASIGPDDIEKLFLSGKVGYLAEVMNVPGVLAGDETLMQKLAAAAGHGVPIDGHAPGLSGEPLARYRAAGITTDHECITLTEAEEKAAAGMKILIREGSAARNFDALHPLIATRPSQVMFCSDDKHPDDLLAGHVNALVGRAVGLGYDLFDVLRCASLVPAVHYNLPIGLLREGDAMDAVELGDLGDFHVRATWIGGHKVAQDGASLVPYAVPTAPNRFHAAPITPSDLALPAPDGAEECHIRAIRAIDGQLTTEQVIRPAKVEFCQLVPDPERDLLMLVVLNRYEPAPPAIAFVEGFKLAKGALASSVAHDSHNIVAAGASVEALCNAINAVIAAKGGVAVSSDGRTDVLPLPVAGLISDRDGDHVGQLYRELDRRAHALGCTLRSPFMTLSFMALLVIPALKLSDKGLFDGENFTFVSLFPGRNRQTPRARASINKMHQIGYNLSQ